MAQVQESREIQSPRFVTWFCDGVTYRDRQRRCLEPQRRSALRLPCSTKAILIGSRAIRKTTAQEEFTTSKIARGNGSTTHSQVRLLKSAEQVELELLTVCCADFGLLHELYNNDTTHLPPCNHPRPRNETILLQLDCVTT